MGRLGRKIVVASWHRHQLTSMPRHLWHSRRIRTDRPGATAQAEPDPTILLLFTRGDTPADWVRAGMALQRVLLMATVRRLAATPLTALTEVPPLRELLADTAAGRVVQTVLRIGYPLTPAVAIPRRPVEEVLVPAPAGPTPAS